MLDRMFAETFGAVRSGRYAARSRLSQERPKRTALPPAAFGKNFEKTSQNVWRFENNSLPLHPLLRRPLRSSAPKKLRKKFRKNLEDMQETPYLCNRFP